MHMDRPRQHYIRKSMDKTQFLKGSQVQGQQEITRENKRPLLEYSDSVWGNCSSDSKKQLVAIHTEAARIIAGATELCSIQKLLTETLQSRHNKHKLVLLYKILHGLVPDYLSELVPPLVQETPITSEISDNVQNYI